MNETELDIKVRTACHRIEELWNETDGKCCVSFSGGKDSTVLLALIKLCQELYTVGDIPAVFSNTGIELGVTVDFVRWVKDNWYPSVEIIRPQVSFDWVLKTKGKPMLSKLKSEYLERWHRGTRSRTVIQNMIEGKTNSGNATWKLKIPDKNMHLLHDDFPIHISEKCCKFLNKKPFEIYSKEKALKGVMTGLREGEGGARELNARVRENANRKVCTAVNKNGFIKKSPLIDWTDEDLENFIIRYNVPLSEAYTKYGFRRTGCMCCPYSQKLTQDLNYLYIHEPNRYKAAMHWLKDVYIAQNVKLPFDVAYEREREQQWQNVYEPMRQEMLRKYRPNSKLIKDTEQLSLFGLEE
jgi:3'-phosphoadenosine 5'-phosphosulfate sulfotransferase (PAPS reductase)/FAD synthetase